MIRHGYPVDTLVVIKDGTTVPESKGDFFLWASFLVVGLPLAGINIFILELVTFISCSCFDSALENQGLEDNPRETDYN